MDAESHQDVGFGSIFDNKINLNTDSESVLLDYRDAAQCQWQPLEACRFINVANYCPVRCSRATQDQPVCGRAAPLRIG